MVFDRAGYKEQARKQLSGNWNAAILVTIMAQCLTFIGILSSTLSESLGFSLLVFLLSGPLDVAAVCFFMNVVNRRPASVNDFFGGLTYFVKAFLVTALAGVLIAIGSILLIVPGVILACMFAFTSYIVAENPNIGVIDALKLSHRMTQGHKFDIFVTYLSFIGWVFISALTLNLADLYVFPYMRTTYGNMFVALRDDLIGRGEGTYEEFGMPIPMAIEENSVVLDAADIACIKDEDVLQAEYEEEFMEEDGVAEAYDAQFVAAEEGGEENGGEK